MPKVNGEKTDVRGVWKTGPKSYRVRVQLPAPDRAGTIDRLVDVEARDAKTAKTRAEAVVAATAGQPKRSERATLGQFATGWLGYKKPTIKRATLELWGTFVWRHVLGKRRPPEPDKPDPIATVFVDALTTEHVKAWRDRQTGSAVSINQRMRLLRRIWRSAAKRYGVPEHQVDFDELGLLPEAPREKTWLDVEQLGALLEALHETGPQWHALVLVMATTGCRSGEATALRVSDIDFERGEIRIVRSHYRGAVGRPKNGRARSAPIMDSVVAVLRGHVAKLEREKDPGYVAEGYLFAAPLPPAEDGSPRYSLRPAATLRKPLEKAARAAGIREKVSAHDLRRTFVNLVREEASGIIVRSIVGHADEAMTERYSRTSHHERKGAVVRSLGPALLGATGRKQGRDDRGTETGIPRDAVGTDKGAG